MACCDYRNDYVQLLQDAERSSLMLKGSLRVLVALAIWSSSAAC
jgi:hypothetical protein